MVIGKISEEEGTRQNKKSVKRMDDASMLFGGGMLHDIADKARN